MIGVLCFRAQILHLMFHSCTALNPFKHLLLGTIEITMWAANHRDKKTKFHLVAAKRKTIARHDARRMKRNRYRPLSCFRRELTQVRSRHWCHHSLQHAIAKSPEDAHSQGQMTKLKVNLTLDGKCVVDKRNVSTARVVMCFAVNARDLCETEKIIEEKEMLREKKDNKT